MRHERHEQWKAAHEPTGDFWVSVPVPAPGPAQAQLCARRSEWCKYCTVQSDVIDRSMSSVHIPQVLSVRAQRFGREDTRRKLSSQTRGRFSKWATNERRPRRWVAESFPESPAPLVKQVCPIICQVRETVVIHLKVNSILFYTSTHVQKVIASNPTG